MSRILFVAAVAGLAAILVPEFARAQTRVRPARSYTQNGQRWQGTYKGPHVTYPSTGRGSRVETQNYIGYRYNTPSPVRRYPSSNGSSQGSTIAPSWYLPDPLSGGSYQNHGR